MKEKILITGGLGFAGMPITKHLLSKGYNVTVIDKLLFNNEQLSKIKSNKFKFFQFDILDSKKIEKFLNVNSFDIIIHLAAIVGDPACRVNENLTIKTIWKKRKTEQLPTKGN